nr:Wadjet anti-phage system protein JetA family protein [Pseudomonas akapageensis]
MTELVLPVVKEHLASPLADTDQDEFSSADANDPLQLTGLVIRALLKDGWLEKGIEREGLITSFKFSRAGKLFAEAFWSLHRPSRSRQRNMRSCRNALDAALTRNDAHDLVDAYEFAERVIEDLTEGIDLFRDLARSLMREASLVVRWDDFMDFLQRFRRDYSKQLTADSATLNRQSIRQNLEKLRTQVTTAQYQRFENDLREIASWAVSEHTGDSVFAWILDRIEEMVDAACNTKQPMFVKSMKAYVRRVTGLVQQSMMLQKGHNRHSFMAVIQRLANSPKDIQDSILSGISDDMAAVEIRLLDPSSFKLRTATQRRKSLTVTIRPRPTREARLEAAMIRAEAEAFSIPNEDIVAVLRQELRLIGRGIRLSSLPRETAKQAIHLFQAVEAVRSAKGEDLIATKLAFRFDADFYSGCDYLIDFRE